MLGIYGAAAQLTGLNETYGVVQLSLISQVSHEKVDSTKMQASCYRHMEKSIFLIREVVKYAIIKVL